MTLGLIQESNDTEKTRGTVDLDHSREIGCRVADILPRLVEGSALLELIMGEARIPLDGDLVLLPADTAQ